MVLDTFVARDYRDKFHMGGYPHEELSYYVDKDVKDTNMALANSGIPLVVKLVYFGGVRVCVVRPSPNLFITGMVHMQVLLFIRGSSSCGTCGCVRYEECRCVSQIDCVQNLSFWTRPLTRTMRRAHESLRSWVIKSKRWYILGRLKTTVSWQSKISCKVIHTFGTVKCAYKHT